jgi:antitoxin component YwqK of YwqJK toxin-antitoxin module
MKKLIYLLPVVFFFTTAVGFGQNDTTAVEADSSGIEVNRLLPTSTPVLLFSDAEDEIKEEKKKKKKKKKNFYFGERTKRGLIKNSFRDQVTYQFFSYTTRNKKSDPYIRDIFWYDTKNKSIKSSGFEPGRGYLLHGPYQKRIGENVVETGMYFFGTKHGRWMSYDAKNILLDKKKYSEGWPKASRITYYNRGENKIEKLTPIEYDLEEGNFFHFYPDGEVAVAGEYKFGERIGVWTEYWPKENEKRVRKREIQYQNEALNNSFKPYIRAEWDKEGNLIYSRN